MPNDKSHDKSNEETDKGTVYDKYVAYTKPLPSNDPIYLAERKIAGWLGVDPEVLDYSIRKPVAFGFNKDAQTDDTKNYQDAMRHVLLAGELERTHPWLSGPLMAAHEFISGALHGQPATAREMDLYNNQIGFDLGKKAKSLEDLELRALNALPRMRVLGKESWIK